MSFANQLHLGCRRVGRHLINACSLWLRGRDCRISHTSVSGLEVTGQTLLKTRVRVGRDRKPYELCNDQNSLSSPFGFNVCLVISLVSTDASERAKVMIKR